MIADAANHPALHAADCGVWDIPRTQDIDLLVSGPGFDDAAATYLTEIAPLYHSLAQVLAQVSGVLLLAMTSRHGAIPLDHSAWQEARRRLAEAPQRMRGLKLPPAAATHFRAMEEIAAHLGAAAAEVEAAATTLAETPREARLRQALARLHAAQKLLVAAAVPDAKITPVDLSHACCNCGATGRAT